MYRFFRATTGLRVKGLPPIEKLLAEAGMQQMERIEVRGSMIYSEILIRRV